MIQRASDSYLMRLTMRAEEGGLWHLHHRGVDPPKVADQGRMGVSIDVVLTPVVNDGRWIVVCPHCAGAQLASPTWPRFLCADCANVVFGGQWLSVEWPEPELAHAGEALLAARPDPATRNWDPTKETIGALKAENVLFGGLFDRQSGAVAGDIGAPGTGHMVPSGAVRPLSRGGE